MGSNNSYNGLEIAIIGISAKFPCSDDYREYWKNLVGGKELITRFSKEEMAQWGLVNDRQAGEEYVGAEGVLQDKQYFDNAFFDYRQEEAALMDPQTRLFHEHCWKALEDAGYAFNTEKQKIGVFATASENDNWKMYVHNKRKEAAVDPFYVSKISSEKYVSTLVAYKINLKGPVIYLDTACSSSLVAVNMACRSLLTRECQIALAGGVSLNTHKAKGYQYREGMTLSADGHCRVFDSGAGGTVPGEGIGIVALKRLQDAIKDRDHIYAIIKASAVNNDGNDKVGYTAPSVKSQSDCIKLTHKLSGIDPKSISYIEAHGTGTRLGDPIEIKALNDAFGTGSANKFCAIGSVKSNLGHLDTTAGMAGLIKAVLCLKHRQIPASLHFNDPNPGMELDKGPFYVNGSLTDWKPAGDFPLRAGVSSFGIGGTNAHILLEEAPAPESIDIAASFNVLTLSAKSETALVRYAHALRSFLVEEPAVHLHNMAYTLQTGRKHFAYRRSIVFKNREELMYKLEPAALNNQVIKTGNSNAQVVFMFSGAGSQYVNMGKGLYETHATFREDMDKGFALMKELTGGSYKNILYPPGEDHRINDMLHTQPVIFIFEYALAKLLMRWGIAPFSMIGHSIGEYVAACISGVFSYEDALRLVVKRGQLMSRMPAGAMLSVSINEEEAGKYLNENISLAAVNAPEQVVFSGDVQSVDRLAEEMEIQDVPHVRLYASIAGHSHMIEDVLEEYRQALEKVKMNPPQIPILSNVTGGYLTREEATAVSYWMRHMRHTVKFSTGISLLLAKNTEKIFIEVGGGHSLTTLLKQQQVNKINPIGINLVRHPKEMEDDVRYLTERLGQLWEQGIQIDWETYHGHEGQRRISLPTYSFDRTPFPTDVDPFANAITENGPVNETRYNSLKDWIYYPVWKSAALPATDTVVKAHGYLFFAPDNELTGLLQSRFLKNGNEWVEIKAGNSYIKCSRNKYIIDPAQPSHYKALFDELRKDQVAVTDIIYGWCIGVRSPHLELNATNNEIHRVYFGLVHIVKELLRFGSLGDKKISLLTDSVHRVTGNEEVHPAQSVIIGLLNALSQEYSVTCRNIDLHLQERVEEYLDELVAEIENTAKDRIVAVRYGTRWLQEFQRHSLPLTKGKSLLKENNTYLITGGLGNVGFIIARYLVQHYRAKIIVTGRKKLPSAFGSIAPGEEEWIDRLKYLMTIGPGVAYYSTDVADLERFNKTVAAIEKDHGPVHGIIHAAGITDVSQFELVEDITLQKAFDIFSPKIGGIDNIYRVFKSRSPDFVWITSSLASVLAGISYASYSAANLYLDHFVVARSKELSNWKCIGLSEMLFTDEEVLAENEQQRTALKPAELCELFEWSLTVKKHPVIMETVADMSSRIYRTYIARQQVYLDEDAGSKAASAKAARPNLTSNYAAPETETEKILVKILEDFFAIENIGVQDSFFELGGDSLKAMVVLKRIKKQFAINLAVKDFFMRPIISQIAAAIDELKFLLQKKNRNSKKII